MLNPRFLSIQRQFDLNIAISLAINDVLTSYLGPAATIKWPNDSYIGNDKIGGILIENIVQGSQIKHAIIGIGLNINQTVFPFYLHNVTSFKKILHIDYDLRTIMNEICRSVEARYLQLKAGSYESLHTDYLNKLYRVDVWARYKIKGEIVSGKISGVSAEGFLQLETDDGLQQFGLKEIEFIKEVL